jgi:hypothetical protein
MKYIAFFISIFIAITLSLNPLTQFIHAQIEVSPSPTNSSGVGGPSNQTQTNTTNTNQSNLIIPPSARSTFRDSLGDLHIVGQLQNNFTFPIQFVQITGTVYDSNHQLVATSDTYTDMDVLNPGAKSGFDILFTNVPTGASSYAVSASYQQASAPKPQALSISVGHQNIDSINAYHLLGEVTNQGNNTATFVKVSAVLFDANHRIIDVVNTFTSPNNLQPGQTAPFDLQSLSPNARQIKFASINAQSEEYSLINKPQSSSLPNNTTPLNNNEFQATTPLISSSSSSSGHHHTSGDSHHGGSHGSSSGSSHSSSKKSSKSSGPPQPTTLAG